jgi:DNA-directed RNA polymerase subunit omega
MARISIEDCQKRIPNRFALVVIAANRSRQLMSNSHPLVKTKNKEAVTALREIAEGKVTIKGESDEQETQLPTEFSEFGL